jgi:hypothetical protein
VAKKAVPLTKKQKCKEKLTQLSSTVAAILHNGEIIDKVSDCKVVITSYPRLYLDPVLTCRGIIVFTTIVHTR